ncbi:MAG TPA: glycosyltransferase family 39 protein [Tepidisphaeraceae bacterium]|nr:glycosyltransferase family 39 protein [Tepidisphaeraceae bacterium]
MPARSEARLDSVTANAAPAPPPRRIPLAGLLLTLILIAAAALRIYNLSALGYWTDEFCTLSTANGWGLVFLRTPMDQVVPPTQPVATRYDHARPRADILPAVVREDAHPPLYILLVRAFEALFRDDSEAHVRAVGVVFSVAAVALLYFVARPFVGTSAALWACLLLAVTGPQIEFSQEAGRYMPLMTFTLAAAWALARMRQRATIGAAIALGAATLAMALTHYFAVGAAFAFGLYALLALGGRARMLAIAAMAIAGVVFMATWGPFMLRQHPNVDAYYGWVQDHAGPGHAARVLLDLDRLPARFLAEPSPSGWSNFVTLVAGVLWLLLPIAFVRRPNLRLFVLWIICAVGLVLCLDLARGTLQLRVLRYTLVATPAACVLIAAAVPRGRWAFVPPALAVTFALLRLPAAYVPPWKYDFRTPVEIVAPRLRAGDALVLASTDPLLVAVSYTAFQHYALPAMPAVVATLTKPADNPTLDRLRACGHVWIVWMTGRATPQQWLPGLRVEQSGELTAESRIVEGRF